MALVRSLVLYSLTVFASTILANSQHMPQDYYVELLRVYAAGKLTTNGDFGQNLDLHKVVSDPLDDSKDAFDTIFDGKTLDDWQMSGNGGFTIAKNDSSLRTHGGPGAIYDIAASSQMVSRPAGMWNTMVIRVIDQLYTVFINGQKVVDCVGDRSTEGYIGLQAHDDQSHVAFRNIMIEDIK
jgi:hypothetical protein